MKSLYDSLTILSIILYLFVLFGVFQFAPAYLVYLTSIIKIYISFILLYKFNPFRNTITITNVDKKMIFSSGVYLLLTTTIGDYLVAYKDEFETNLVNKIIK